MPFKCSQCDGRFTDNYTLRRHVRYNHAPGNSVACTECNRHFASDADLAVHMVTHSRTKIYSCPVCNRGFRQGLLT